VVGCDHFSTAIQWRSQGRAAEALTAAFTSSFYRLAGRGAPDHIFGAADLVIRAQIRAAGNFFRGLLADVLLLCRPRSRGPSTRPSFSMVARPVGGRASAWTQCPASLRMTFGSNELLRGINFLVAVIGLFWASSENPAHHGRTSRVARSCRQHQPARGAERLGKILPNYWVNAGAFVVHRLLAWHYAGPAPIAASFMATNLAKRFFQGIRRAFGKGRIEGVVRARKTAAPRLRPRRRAGCRCWRWAFPGLRPPRRSCSAGLMVLGHQTPGPPLLFVEA